MNNRHSIPPLNTLCILGLLALYLSAPPLSAQEGQANKPRVNNEKPGNRGQVKRVHPHALKLILQGKKEEAIAYLKETAEFAVNPEHTQMLLDIANGKSDTWKYDAKSWPWERVLPNTSLKKDAPTDKFTIAFGGGSGYVPENERVWNTIGALEPRAVLLLGDNVYIDDPETPEMQRFHYYRRQSQPEWMRLAKRVRTSCSKPNVRLGLMAFTCRMSLRLPRVTQYLQFISMYHRGGDLSASTPLMN